ncbi:pyruvate formate-lyase activating enzyme [Thermoproteus uzoniensis 768-20]|uniref:Pyruvate formate-lyase activating enzyme n=1 Tax=Thermoproteus uzoniensis (strain 768-20) TaxID=999630 RepID=F2L2F8_THEU7|nr:AmmeMemoRadiSam system radical SAM enzyme [Thermoproteus uzoniensis]AEA11823.1 pyruvate formate-lyase activating enzyme [Thermoproteus uzoniensis 768-20]
MPIYSWPRPAYKPSAELLRLPNVRPSPYQIPAGGAAICTLCHRKCRLEPGAVGACGVRFNLGGRLYTAVYGLLTAAESRPVEIKPLFHFYPGTSAMTISTWGCNFPCAWCQNWQLSKAASLTGTYAPPEKIVEWALENGDSGVNVSFNEPTLLAEYAEDLFRLARARGLHASINTNGYLSEEAVERLAKAGMEAMNVDIKGGRSTYRRWLAAELDKVLATSRLAKSLGVHLEFTYLVIPGVNDGDAEEVIDAVASFGRDTPLHVTAYYPAHRLNNPPTPPEMVEEIWRRARRELDYVYVGNLPGHPGQHTYCPNCGYPVIKRAGDRAVRIELRDGKCPRCGREIPIRGRPGRYGRLYRAYI